MNTVKKVFVWRAISTVITVIITYAWTGSATAATGLTIALQGVLFISHWIFEEWCMSQSLKKLFRGPPKKRPSGLDDEGDMIKDWRPGKF